MLRPPDPKTRTVTRLLVRLDPIRLRRWHLRLVERLTRRPDIKLCVEWTASEEELPSAIALLFALERLIYGLPDDDTVSTADVNEFAPFLAAGKAPADLVLDFTASVPRAGERTWQVTFDGVAGDAAALGALVQGRTPVVAIIDASTRVEVVSGHPGTESKSILVLAFQDVLARTTTLVDTALNGVTAPQVVALLRGATIGTGAVTRFALRSLSRALVGWLYHLCYNAPHWRVGWRFVDGFDIIDLRAHPIGGWRELPDDRHRFYADPFPIAANGRTYLFVEEFEHRLRRGIISAVEFNEAGPVGIPRPVLETSSHLSYPFVFKHRGEMWMVPESCATSTIDLYRGAPFPDQWTKEATLVSGLVASDATLFEHGDRWWMFATVRDDGGAYSDALYIWSSHDLLGPWQPHRHNPLVVDIATARPAGHIVRRGGKLIRPFQDCREGYGSALGLAEITQLDDDGFAQRVETVLRPGPLWPGRRLHTLNRAGRLECIDGSASSRRF
jgi:hypothetical protein